MNKSTLLAVGCLLWVSLAHAERYTLTSPNTRVHVAVTNDLNGLRYTPGPSHLNRITFAAKFGVFLHLS